MELGDTVRPTYLHTFTRHEIEDELGSAGFDLVQYAEEPYGRAVGLAKP